MADFPMSSSVDLLNGKKVFEFKVVLRNTRPAVERRILISGDNNLGHLSRAAINAVGMPDSNLDLWGPDNEHIRGYDPLNSDSDSDSNSEKTEKKRNSKDLIICSFFDLGDRNHVVLDYGHDGWRYVITLMKIRERDLKWYPKFPRCIGGRNACPPEGIGGPEGYNHLLKTLKNPKHNEHNDSKDWLTSMGLKYFDPSEFTFTPFALNK